MHEVDDRAGARLDLPVLSMTKAHGPVLASERFSKVLHSRDVSRYRVARRGLIVADPMLLWDGSIGTQRVVDAGLVSPDYRVYAPRDNVDAEFLSHVVRSPAMRPFYQGGARGTNVRRNRIARSDFLQIPLALPPIGEQRKIADILSAVDSAIEATQSVIDRLQAVKKAMMAELLTHGLPGRHMRFKQTEVGEVPEVWTISIVGECCKIRDDLRKPINAAERAKIPGPYPYYGPTRALDLINEYRLDGTFALIGEDGDHFLKFDRWKMTQLISGRFCVNNHAHVIAGTVVCSAAWFACFYQHRDITQRLTRQGANRYKLRKVTLEELPIPLPPMDEQVRICEALTLAEGRESAESEASLACRD